MNYLQNKLIIFLLKILNKFKRGLALKNKIFSSQRILERNFPIKTEFNFIQVGANDGISFDFLYDFVISRQSSGLVIEPVMEYFQELLVNYKDYPDIKKINKAVHSSAKIKEIYKIKESKKQKYPEWVKGIASFDPHHHKKTHISKKDMDVEIVSADTLMNIMSDNNMTKRIDYVQIDTEGYDYEILKMLDLYIIKPQMIKFEHINLEKAEIFASNKFLVDHGFFIFREGNDTCAVDLRRIKLL
jgi:FkbM family methyltransferase